MTEIPEIYGNWKLIGKASRPNYWIYECQCENHTRFEFRKSHIIANEARKQCKICGDKKIGMIWNNMTCLRKNLDKTTRKHSYYDCICNYCGAIFITRGDHIGDSRYKSCGCQKTKTIKYDKLENLRIGDKIDYTGFTNGKIKIIRDLNYKDKRGYNMWLAECECGATLKLSSKRIKEQCPYSCGCIRSIGEYNIARILTENGIAFEKEKTFSDLKGSKNGFLRYDFFLPDYNILLEFDGKQHFQEVSFFRNSLEERQKYDSIKDTYAERHGYTLIRIPYEERDNITLGRLLNKGGDE